MNVDQVKISENCSELKSEVATIQVGGMDLENRNGEPYDQGLENSMLSDTLENSIRQIASRCSSSIRETDLEKNNSDNTRICSSTEEYFNNCVYSCEICQSTVHSEKRFFFHLLAVHSMSYEKYLEQYCNPILMLNVYKCLICGNCMTWDETYVIKHLIERHENMTLQDYKTLFNIS